MNRRYEIIATKPWTELLSKAKDVLVADRTDREYTDSEIANQASYMAQKELDEPYDQIMELTAPKFDQVSLAQNFTGFYPDGGNPDHVEYRINVVTFWQTQDPKNPITDEEREANFDLATQSLEEAWTLAGFDWKKL